MTPLRFATWNVRGFRNRVKQSAVVSFAKNQGIDLLFVQEANFRTPLDVTLFRRNCQVEGFFSLTNAKACGVGVIFVSGRYREKAHCVFGADGRTLLLDLFIDGRKFRFTNVYAPVTRSDTNRFFRDLHAYLLEPLPHVVLGDFNCVVDTTRDVRGPGRGGSSYHAKELTKILRHLMLTDAWVHHHGDDFVPTRTSRHTESRLDRIYVPDMLLPLVISCEVLALPNTLVKSSDHAPVVVTVKAKPGARRRDAAWRLDPVILQDDECVARIRSRLESSLLASPCASPADWDDLKATWRELLQQEGSARKKRLTARLNEILRRIRIIQSADALTTCTRDYLDSLMVQHDRLLSATAKGTRAARAVPGDPSDADLREVSGNGSLRISEVLRPDGTLTSDPAEIEATFRDHFKVAFSEPDPSEVQPDPALDKALFKNLRRLEVDECETLCAPASLDELRQAIRSMSPNSAPGIDGLTAGFYMTFFDVLGAPLLHIVNLVLGERAKPASFGAGRIVLILKDGAPPNDPSSWRPITLLNVDYKIVAAIVNNRTKVFLPDLIAPHQSCAVPGRSMYTNLTLTRDVFEYASYKRVAGAFLSLDQAKAFDRVRHSYLLGTLAEFGFPEEFVAVIALLYQDLQCCVAVNGATTDSFPYTRGIRQGCPLGPTLFVLSIEPLITSVASDERIRGLPLTGLEELKILAFADDLSLFLRDARSLVRFRQVFSTYAAASGARLNEAKSKALLFGPFPAEAIGTIEAVSAVKVLGVLFTCEGVAASTWRRVIDRAHLLIERAKLSDLTLRDKAVAVKTSICALASHVSRVTTMPTRIANHLNQLITAFMWDGNPPPVKRHLLQLAPSEGGLGLPHVQTTSKILALKTARALAQKSDYAGRGLLLYWSSVGNDWLEAGGHSGPFAESPSPFYRVAAATMRMLAKEVPGCEIESDPPARLVETLTAHQLDEDDKRRARRAMREIATFSRDTPREVQDFLWKRAWNVLPTRQRLHHFGIVPDARCPNCRETETQDHALLNCPAARPVWRMIAQCFGIRPPPNHRRNKGTFARVVFALTLFVIWQRRSLAEARRKPVRAAYPTVSRIKRLVWAHLSEELEASGEESFLRRWHTRFFFLRNGKLVSPLIPY